MLEEAIVRYQSALLRDERALAFLEKEKGVDWETALTVRFGVVDDPAPGHGPYRGWLSIPYLRHDGEPLQLRFRCLNPGCGVGVTEKENHEGHGKYMSLEDEPVRIYGIQSIHEAGNEIHVTEGEFDRNTLRYKMDLPAVGLPGATQWQTRHRKALAGFSRIWVWADPDDAGAKFARKVCASLRQAKVVPLKHGDVTKTYVDLGLAGLRKALEEVR
jgi:hypothetical protein